MADTISWMATIATVIAASMTAANLGTRMTGYGFCVFLLGSLSWLAASLLTGQPALMWTNAVLTVLNIFGIWRWLGRQSRIEEGASVAAEASKQSSGESLFPVSLLLKASIEDGRGNVLGTCVDAMAGCRNGDLRYVVASEGGVAGVGETLRRIPWQQSRMESDRLITNADRIDSFAKIEKGEWPAR
jgi:hypothetical protein